MKELYSKPVAEIEEFAVVNIFTVSDDPIENGGDMD